MCITDNPDSGLKAILKPVVRIRKLLAFFGKLEKGSVAQ